MLTASAALKCILDHSVLLEDELVPLLQARGRYLSSDLHAPISLPPFDSSAMDGFALRAEETCFASLSSPAAFKIVDTLPAGIQNLEQAPLKTGAAVRIMTGAPLPQGADTVLPFEDAEEKDGFCLVRESLKSGRHVRLKGEDIQSKDLILKSGTPLNVQNMALLAALGMSEVPVVRLPKLALFATGNELQALGYPLKPGQIYDSNSPSLSLVLQELGILAQNISTPQDKIENLEKAFFEASEAEVILSMGAVSAGDFDLIPEALEKIGAKILFHKIAIKPGKPLLFAQWEHRLIFCLPGNPVSALVVFDRFVRPALLKKMGASDLFRKTYQAYLSQEISGTMGKQDYLRASVEWKEDRFIAKLSGGQGSAQLGSFAKSNALIILPESIKTLKEGEKVNFEFWSNL